MKLYADDLSHGKNEYNNDKFVFHSEKSVGSSCSKKKFLKMARENPMPVTEKREKTYIIVYFFEINKLVSKND